jgi:hypothetical protein
VPDCVGEVGVGSTLAAWIVTLAGDTLPPLEPRG